MDGIMAAVDGVDIGLIVKVAKTSLLKWAGCRRTAIMTYR